MFERKNSARAVILSLAIGAAALVSRVSAEIAYPPIVELAPENPFTKVNGVIPGLMFVSEGAKFRNYPAIARNRLPGQSYLAPIVGNNATAAVRWDQIDAINGISLARAKVISIKNSYTVIGEDPDKDQHMNSYAGPYQADWLKVALRKKGETVDETYFVSVSSASRKYVQPASEIVQRENVLSQNADTVVLEDGKQIKIEDIGVTRVYPQYEDLESMWQDPMRQKIAGQKPLEGLEKFYKRVSVVPVTVNCDNARRIIEDEKVAEVQPYLGPSYAGEPEDEEMFIRYGTPIKNTLLLGNPGRDAVFNQSDVVGAILDKNGNPLAAKPKQVLQISDNYLLSDEVEFFCFP